MKYPLSPEILASALNDRIRPTSGHLIKTTPLKNMTKLSDTTTRKFIDSIELEDEWEIESDDGWVPITHIHKTVPYTEWEIQTATGNLICADTHILYDENLNEIYAKDLIPFKSLVMLDTGPEIVISVTKTDKESNMFDLSINSENHRFYANRFLSHNSITTIGYILWLSLFRADQAIAILANKGQLARDLLDRYQLAYEGIPHFLQQGISIWQKGKVELENNSKIFASSTSANSLRGSSINFLLADEFAFVHNNMAEAFFNSIFPVISSGESTKLVVTSCVVKDTYIFTPNGIKQVADYINHNMPDNPNFSYNIPRYSVYGIDGVRSGEYFCNNGQTETRIIRSSSTILECSLEHKFWAYKNGKFAIYRAKELTTDDYISIKYGENIWGNDDDISDYIICQQYKHNNTFIPPKTITPDLAYFLGLFLAEGYALDNKKGKRVTISCGDNISYIFEILNMFYYVKYDEVHYSVNSSSLIDFIKYFGFDTNKKAKEKVIPKRLFSCSKEIIAAFLSGFFDGDGCATNRGKISCSSASKELIEQIRILLLNFGILTQYYTKISPPTKKVKVESKGHILEINNYKDCLKFYNEIGFRLERKQIKKNLLKIPTRKLSKDIIPDARIFFKQHGLKIQEDSSFKKTNHVTRERCLEVKGVEQFPEIFHPNLKWEKIKSIEESENWVGDFSLDHIEGDRWCHFVLYNGIIGEQTPSGMNHFYKMWTDAIAGRNGYKPVRVRWSDVPGRDEKYKEDFIKATSLRQWQQEMESVDSKSIIDIDGREMAIKELYENLKNNS